MNAAYLMLTTAWLAGADPVPAAAPAGAPLVSTSTGSCNGGYGGCGGYAGGDACCDSGRQRLCDRIKGMFKGRGRGDCGCEAAPTCCAPAPVVVKAAPTCCAPAQASCDDDCGRKRVGCFAKLRARFSRNNNCGCDTGCDSGCGSSYGGVHGGVITAPAGSAEPIQAAPKPSTGGAPMPSKPAGTPMTMNGVISNVTPVAAPASPF